jgi:hypothetical protein
LPGYNSLYGSAELLDPGSPLSAFRNKTKLLQQVSGLAGIITILGQCRKANERLVQNGTDVSDSLQQCGDAMI